jgi:hypothetical protein
MSTIHLPEYAEWVGSDAWKAHLGNHGAPWHEPMPKSEGCPSCVVGMFMPAIHDAYFNGGKAHLIYELQDGYGTEGYVPEQGYDWSGVRDSSPAAIQCGAISVDWVDHICLVADLPKPLISKGSYSIRETPGNGRGLWKSYRDGGRMVAYFLGCTWGADADALAIAIDEAEEEMACLMADARREFA